jgi:Outer membrane protein
MLKKTLLSLLAIILFYPASYALEIPITGALQRDKETSSGIIFVDMDRVFNSHPMSERYKNELKDFAKTRKNAIEEMVKRHDALQEQIRGVNIKITQAHDAGDEAELGKLSQEFEAVQRSMEEQRLKIADLSQRTKNELAVMEETHTMTVLKDIEVVLREVSKKYDAEVMLDKQSVLCGSESCEDVTDEVIKKLEGR